MTEDELLTALASESDRSMEWISPLDLIALQVGLLSQNWAHLEGNIRRLLQVAARMPDDVASDLVLRCFDFRDQLAAIKVAIVALMYLSEELKDEIIATLDYIDNTLRPRRNRLIHDLWTDEEGSKIVTRVAQNPRINRPQARQPRVVTLSIESETTDDVGEAICQVEDYSAHIRAITDVIGAPTPENIQALLATWSQEPGAPHRRTKHV